MMAFWKKTLLWLPRHPAVVPRRHEGRAFFSSFALHSMNSSISD